jgi:putative PIN family toxin of toxin-antitoxin system
LRIVFDSNILVSAFANSQSLAYELLQAVLTGPHALLISNEMLAELSRVLRYPRLVIDHGENEETIYEYIGWLRHSATIVPLNPLTVAPIRDANDVIFLQAALNGEADILCSKDRDFFEPPASLFLASCSISVLTDVQLMRILRS